MAQAPHAASPCRLLMAKTQKRRPNESKCSHLIRRKLPMEDGVGRNFKKRKVEGTGKEGDERDDP